MDKFIMKIAGLAVEVSPMFLSTREYCKAYLWDGNADVAVQVTHDALDHEQAIMEQEAVQQWIRPRKFPRPFLERAVILRKVGLELLERGTLLLHGSTAAVDGHAYLFTAPCGTGKSTHTRLWREVFGERVKMINDDKTFLSMEQGTVIAHGSPWSGKHGLANNLSLPLKGICLIKRGRENSICRILPDDAALILSQQILAPVDVAHISAANRILEDVMSRVAIWELTCNMDPQAAEVSYSAMSVI